ncbi:hypothetical protein SDRG_16024 [Saprolegnia diclina VS20]|uniref:Adenosinetriphosphatase n=1 Tax=Saprolegnia diclina (strain VS20) TaxID=1156394 RepID=T0R286_SAPDV|nr:hypothetical protein SDRG_16024 [Saprolegnia diclina VS20]EQC26133.1 hypothetical protein SDRG_16024 [Saprolegnia diclina VS20]|eukprot:XP_008620435.1 hypothetical protein SDRG_16024 [Saprolegnia diclina VS20]
MDEKDSPTSDQSSVTSFGSIDTDEAGLRTSKRRGSLSRSKRSAIGLRTAAARKRRKLESGVVSPESPAPDDASAEEIEALQQAKQAIMDQLEALDRVSPASPLSLVDGVVTTAAPPVVLSRRTSRATLPNALQTDATASFRHWDFLLQEMQWMATDFTQERKWRLRKAKMLSVSVLSHHNKKATAATRSSQHEEAHRKRLAAKIGRDVKKFWLQIDKVVAHQFKVAEDARQKDEMEFQLQFLVAQTENYATALATTFALPMDAEASEGSAVETTDEHVLRNDVDSDGDFVMQSGDVLDDETTIAFEEAAQSAEDTALELALLDEEGQLSIDELRARYAAMAYCDTDSHVGAHHVAHDSPRAGDRDGDDEDYSLGSDIDDDDETTIAAEEAAQTAEDTKNELAELEADANLSIDELRAKYSSAEAPSDDAVSHDGDFEMETESGDDESTIAIEEAAQSAQDTADELAQLEADADMSIEELRARYVVAGASEIGSSDSDVGIETDFLDEETTKRVTRPVRGHTGTLAQLTASTNSSGSVQAAQASATSVRAGVSQTEQDLWEVVGVARPFLLRPSLHLRAYQTAGVAWLLSLAHNRMNGILADEMGLGKTIQTISMLAALATEGIWGPHLIVVPTSCILNWEMELKRWCPAFKIMTYYGSAKRRKDLRNGWSKTNAFQVCITSYQLVVADAPCFKRKKWYYLVLDEAHNIKNWKSQRWQTLLTFNTQRRLLLTGTPLQNNLMELWSLMHFLMPHLFRSRAQFTYWFNNPLNAMVEGEAAVNASLVARLHRIIRPFVLRRLKKDVAKQMPGKFEHVLMCPLSKRQTFLYEDFMARSSTRKAMAGGNFVGMMNVLMQLRKVCNHPDLFEPRPISSPWDVPPLTLTYPLSASALAKDPPPCVPLLEASGVAERLLQSSSTLVVDDVFLAPPIVPDSAHPLVKSFMVERGALLALACQTRQSTLVAINWRRCQSHVPLLTHEMLHACTLPQLISAAMDVHARPNAASDTLQALVVSGHRRFAAVASLLPHVLCYVHAVRTRSVQVDVSGPLTAGRVREAERWAETSAAIRESLAPLTTALHHVVQRSHLFFPDKRLVQFDCGKLQQLDRLLRDLKRDGHRCLIFSQMSSMLNILEIFLNIHGHTYFRLDGSTPVEKRQRLMDRFNADEKVFCFILSTRSGGLGINLTGADTVIFYDSDWNPAMDAQAQDRAHRIGQTRDVHIYRLVSEHTVEENILRKAQQKRHLDVLVMAEGQFTTEYFTKASLRDLVTPEAMRDAADGDDEALDMSAVENAMAQIEDVEDVAAMQAAKAAQRVEKEEDDAGFDDDVVDAASIAADMDNDTALLHDVIEEQLRSIDRMAIGFRTHIDPMFVALPTVSMETIHAQDELELERIEAEKIVEEESVIEDGDLIVAEMSPALSVQQRVYQQERRQVLRARRLRAISGTAWKILTCLKSSLPFYLNEDTREAQWERPRILLKNQEDRTARDGGYASLPVDVLARIAVFTTPLERLTSMARVCKSWSQLALHSQFYVRLHSEAGVERLSTLLSGDTVVLGSGIHRVPHTVIIRTRVRLLAPLNGGTSTMLLAPGAQLQWHANGGEIRGLHIAGAESFDATSQMPLVVVPPGGHIAVVNCDLTGGDACVAVHGGVAVILDSTLHDARGSGVVVAGGSAVVVATKLRNHGQCGISVLHGTGIFRKNTFERNRRYGIRLLTGTQLATVDGNRFIGNGCGALDLEHSSRRIVVRQSQIVPDDVPIVQKPHSHQAVKLQGLQLEDLCREKPQKEVRKKKVKVPTDHV